MPTQSIVRHVLLCMTIATIIPLAVRSASAETNSARPEIVSRAAWGANPPNLSLMKAQKAREIIIHHTGEKQRPQQTLEEKLRKLQRFSQTRGTVGTLPKPAWGDVPYHFYVDATGRIGEGRDIAYAGDTNTKYETANRIQIVLEGHFDEEQPTAAQLGALDRLVVWLVGKYRVPASKISGHNDHVATTECPGRHLKSYLPALRRKAAEAAVVR